MRFPQVPRTGLNLRDIFKQAYHAEPYQALDNKDATPFELLLRRSQGIDLARQYLPRALGGYGKAKMAEIDRTRARDPQAREQSLRVGDYPVLDGLPLPPQNLAAKGARRAAQAAGALASDITTQGAQNIWWFINAFEAASMAAGQQAMHGALKGVGASAPAGTPFSRGSMRVAATFPLVLGASAATGTLFRQPGYSAVLPSEEDRTESANPVKERLLRTIGRTGTLLPYDDFVRERPDVSRDEYERYKAFLFGDKSPVKFTGDGIHGPEVNFLGKSIPLLTGLMPIAAGVVGGRVGLRTAGRRLAQDAGGVNQFATLEARNSEVSRLQGELRNPNLKPARARQLEVDLAAAEKRRTAQLNLVEGRLMGGAVVGSSIGMGITAAGAALLEQIRRAGNLEENRRRAAETTDPTSGQQLPG